MYYIMCDVRTDCAHLYMLKCAVLEVYLESFQQAKNNYVTKKKRLSKSFCNKFLVLLRVRQKNYCSIQVEDRH